MRILLFLAGILLSGTAAYYSVLGLQAIFNGAFIPILVMGGSIELAKVVTATFLHRSWKQIPALMKSGMCVAVVVFMFLTSMGIFGFLSKAHLENSANKGAEVTSVVAELRADIDIDNKIVADVDKQIQMLDGTVKDDYNTIRRQKSLRASLNADKKAALKRLRENNRKLAAADLEVKKVEVEFGPLKYIAELIYGDAAGNNLDNAVRYVILMIVFVFDPLAILLLIAASSYNTMMKPKQEEVKKEVVVKHVPPKPKKEKPIFGHPNDALVNEVELDNDDDEIVLEISNIESGNNDVITISKKDILNIVNNKQIME
jgi:hypothetical protein